MGFTQSTPEFEAGVCRRSAGHGEDTRLAVVEKLADVYGLSSEILDLDELLLVF